MNSRGEMIKNVTGSFDPITLAEMDSVKLLDRTDTKYIFHVSRLQDVMDVIRQDYNVLDIQNVRNNAYETLYYDTSSFDLYLRHHNEKLNRYKIRFRKYVNSNIHFFEIKFKNNKGRTIKSRIQLPEIEMSIRNKAKKLLEEVTNFSSEILQPVFWVNYSRITLVSKNFTERLTIDLDLTFKNDSGEKKFDSLVVAELKQDKASLKSPFAKAMYHAHIKQNSISKYCLGVTQLIYDIKKNNFKPKLLTLNKILNVA